MGRPAKITGEAKDKFYDLLADGWTYQQLAERFDVSYKTVLNYAKKLNPVHHKEDRPPWEPEETNINENLDQDDYEGNLDNEEQD